jgi:hypothetical protein
MTETKEIEVKKKLKFIDSHAHIDGYFSHKDAKIKEYKEYEKMVEEEANKYDCIYEW